MGEGHESGNGYARIFEKTFGDDLVHRYRRAEYAGTHHGNVKRFQHALNTSVFTVRTVQYGKYDVDLDTIAAGKQREAGVVRIQDRKSTRLNSSHVKISYAVFCLKKKNHLRT